MVLKIVKPNDMTLMLGSSSVAMVKSAMLDTMVEKLQWLVKCNGWETRPISDECFGQNWLQYRTAHQYSTIIPLSPIVVRLCKYQALCLINCVSTILSRLFFVSTIFCPNHGVSTIFVSIIFVSTIFASNILYHCVSTMTQPVCLIHCGSTPPTFSQPLCIIVLNVNHFVSTISSQPFRLNHGVSTILVSTMVSQPFLFRPFLPQPVCLNHCVSTCLNQCV